MTPKLAPDLFRELEFQKTAEQIVQRSQERAPAPVHELAPEEDYFGEDLPYPDGPTTGDGFGSIGGIKGTGSRFKPREHYPRAIKALCLIHPGLYWACDMKVLVGRPPDMSLKDRDSLGTMDIIGITRTGQMVGANVTTAASIDEHVRKWTDPRREYGGAVYGEFENKRVLTLTRKFLANGGLLFLLGAWRPAGGRIWQYEIRTVDEALLSEFIGRKRK